MHIALRRRLRLPLPPAAQRCGQGAGRHGCGGALDPLGDHALACPRSGLLARRAHVLEHAWIRVAREAVGSEGRVVPQPWLAHTNLATAVDDRRRLDLLIHGATPRGEALACDVTLVSPLTPKWPAHPPSCNSRWGSPACRPSAQTPPLSRAAWRGPPAPFGTWRGGRRAVAFGMPATCAPAGRCPQPTRAAATPAGSGTGLAAAVVGLSQYCPPKGCVRHSTRG